MCIFVLLSVEAVAASAIQGAFRQTRLTSAPNRAACVTLPYARQMKAGECPSLRKHDNYLDHIWTHEVLDDRHCIAVA